MKNKLLIIFTYIVLVAMAAEVAYGVLQKRDLSEVIKEKEEKGKTTDGEFEKEDSKVKALHHVSIQQGIANTKSFFVLSHIYFISSAYLSLPDIPPEKA